MDGLKSPGPEAVVPVSEASARAFADALPRLLTLVNDKFTLAVRLSGEGSTEDLALVYDAHRHFGDMLRAVFEFSLYKQMLEEFSWYTSAMSSRGLDEVYFRKMVEAWIIAVHAAIEHREACDLSRPLEWLAANSAHVYRRAAPSEPPSDRSVRDFLDTVLAGRRRDAVEQVLRLADRGNVPEDVVSGVILPAMTKVGRFWESNEISVSQEHAATEISRYALQRVMEEMPSTAPLGLKAIAGCVPGEQHDVGALLSAAHLEARGWEVIYLGRSTPEKDLLRTVKAEEPPVCVFSMTLIGRLPAARDLFVGIRNAAPRTRIISGGHAAEVAARALAPYSDAVLGDFRDIHETALRLVADNA